MALSFAQGHLVLDGSSLKRERMRRLVAAASFAHVLSTDSSRWSLSQAPLKGALTPGAVSKSSLHEDVCGEKGKNTHTLADH